VKKTILFLLTAAAFCAGAAEPKTKYNPGHYIAVDDSRLETFPYLDEPAIRGFIIRYLWASLEPVENQYDFSAVKRDLEVAARHGKRLVVFANDKTFGPNIPNPVPEYMRAFAVTNLTGGVSVLKWEPRVLDREIALAAAIGKQFDANPNFEGLAWQESAPSIPRDRLTAAGYTPEIFRDALIQRSVQHCSRIFPDRPRLRISHHADNLVIPMPPMNMLPNWIPTREHRLGECPVHYRHPRRIGCLIPEISPSQHRYS